LSGPELPIHFVGRVLPQQRHICAFFNARDDEYQVTLPFIREGFDRGERAFHIVGPVEYDQHVRRLAEFGIDTAGGLSRGQLAVRLWEEAYLRGGHFDQDAMLALIESVLQEGPKLGFPLTRLVAHMEWALEDRPGVDDLLEYETRLNYVLPRYKDPVV